MVFMGCHFMKRVCGSFGDREMAKEFFWDIIGDSGDKAAVCNLVNYYSAGKGLYFICEGNPQHCPLKGEYVTGLMREHVDKNKGLDQQPAAGQPGA
jgi:hypothetical protein